MTTNTTTAIERALLPCPFCGGQGVFCFNKNRPSTPMHWVLCRDCHATPGEKATKDEAIDAWNQRTTLYPTPTEQPGAVQDIEGAAKYVFENSRRGTASLNNEQRAADDLKMLAAYRDIIGKALDFFALPTAAPTREIPREVQEASKLALMYLETGFITCDRCGHEQPTNTLDAAYELRYALTATPAPTPPTEAEAREVLARALEENEQHASAEAIREGNESMWMYSAVFLRAMLAFATTRPAASVEPRPFSEWREDYGDVLWFRYPIAEPPYCGTPLDLGFSVPINLEVAGHTFDTVRTDLGGWPFGEDDEESLWWTPLPDFNAINDAINHAILTAIQQGEKG